MLKMVMDDLPMFPAYYNPGGVAFRKGVEGIGTGSVFTRVNVQDIHRWDMR